MATETWQADTTRSEITFKLRHLVLATISGRFRVWRAAIRIDPDQPSRSTVEASMDASSLDTGLAERDEHLRSAEFLNAGVHPEVRFKSSGVTRTGDSRYFVTGDLTVAGVTCEVPVEVEDLGRTTDSTGVRRARFRAHASFNRQDFRLHWNQDLDTGGIVVGDKVGVTIQIEAVESLSSGLR